MYRYKCIKMLSYLNVQYDGQNFLDNDDFSKVLI